MGILPMTWRAQHPGKSVPGLYPALWGASTRASAPEMIYLSRNRTTSHVACAENDGSAVSPGEVKMLKLLSTHALIVLIYLSLGLSLGCYYTATYFGATGWPLPSCEAIAGVFLYYFSVVNAATELQAVHWIVVFVTAGYLWIASLWYVSPKLTGPGTLASQPDVATLPDRFAILGRSVALSTLPLAMPIPFMAWWMGSTDGGFSWSRFIAVCLRHAWVTPPSWLNHVYFVLATITLATQIVLVRRQLRMNWKRFSVAFALAFGTLVVISIASGTLLSYPLRLAFE